MGHVIRVLSATLEGLSNWQVRWSGQSNLKRVDTCSIRSRARGMQTWWQSHRDRTLFQTAQTVIVAQTNSFLTSGRRASFHVLPQKEQDIQLKEGYGRATLALTRCIILFFLMGYVFRAVRPSVSYNDAKRTIPVREKQQKHLRHWPKQWNVTMRHSGTTWYERTWSRYCHWIMYGAASPSDADFGRLLARSNSLTSSYLPPLVIAEALQDNVSHWCKIRRLHLIIVDTWSP